jgi:MFS family permease
MVGLGLSTVVPLAFSAAGRLPNIPASTGIAGVATIGYAGFLAGPPIIGLVAEATDLTWSMIFVAVLAASLIFTSQSLSKVEKRKVE